MGNLPIDSDQVLAWKFGWQEHPYEKSLLYCICSANYEVLQPRAVAREASKAGQHIQRVGRFCISHGRREVDY